MTYLKVLLTSTFIISTQTLYASSSILFSEEKREIKNPIEEILQDYHDGLNFYKKRFYKKEAGKLVNFINNTGVYLAKTKETRDKLKKSLNKKDIKLNNEITDLIKKQTNAASEMGFLYMMGSKGLKQDHDKAIKFFTLALNNDSGHIMANYNRGVMWSHGWGPTGYNIDEAIKCYTIAAGKDKDAQYNLGTNYRIRGDKDKGDFENAHKWLERASNTDNQNLAGRAIHNRIALFLEGNGSQKQTATSVSRALIQNADAGSLESKLTLAWSYLNENSLGITRNFQKGEEILTQLSELLPIDVENKRASLLAKTLLLRLSQDWTQIVDSTKNTGIPSLLGEFNPKPYVAPAPSFFSNIQPIFKNIFETNFTSFVFKGIWDYFFTQKKEENTVIETNETNETKIVINKSADSFDVREESESDEDNPFLIKPVTPVILNQNASAQTTSQTNDVTPKKQKVKTRGNAASSLMSPQKKITHEEARKTMRDLSSTLSQKDLETVQDFIESRGQIKWEEMQQIFNIMNNAGVTVKNTKNGLALQFDTKSTSVHHPHQNGNVVNSGAVKSVRNFVNDIIAQQEH